MSTTVRGTIAIARSNSAESTAETGKAILGQFILVTRFEFEVKLLVANRMALMKNAHGRALTVIDARLSGESSTPDIFAIATRMSIPAPTMIAGMRIAHSNPMTDCLYFILISRHVRTNSRSLRTCAVRLVPRPRD